MKKIVASLFCLLALQVVPVQQSEAIVYKVFDNYEPTGYMGDVDDVIILPKYKDATRPNSQPVKIAYIPGVKGWAGVYWQYPAGNWCKQKGKNLSTIKPTKLSFWVKGHSGGEIVNFKIGQDCGDSYVSPKITKTLTKNWEKVMVNLINADLSNMSGAFSWSIDTAENVGPVIFYLDEVQFE